LYLDVENNSGDDVGLDINQLRSFLKKGIVQCVLVTPFKENSEVDYDAYRELVKFIKEKAKNKPFVLTPGGTTGEGYALTDNEWERIVDITIEEAGSSFPVIPGIIEPSVHKALLKANKAESLGASGVMIVLPSYIVPNENGLLNYYSEIAKKINIGVVVYNNPDVSKIYIKPHLLRALAEKHDNVVGVKENTPSVPTLYSQLKTAGDMLAIWQGRGEWWYSATFHLGVAGFASGLSNFAPQMTSELLEAGLTRNFDKIDEIREKIWLLERFFSKMELKYGPTTTILPPPYTSSYVSISVIKAAMNALGLRGGRVRVPLNELSREDLEELEKILVEGLGLTKYG
jgi:4-hydroxy-tetrahydrodipicolinate synthase